MVCVLFAFAGVKFLLRDSLFNISQSAFSGASTTRGRQSRGGTSTRCVFVPCPLSTPSALRPLHPSPLSPRPQPSFDLTQRRTKHPAPPLANRPCAAMAPPSSTKAPKPPKPNHSSLSSIVSHLVRSSLGAAAPSADVVGDDKLDRHVAELLLKEAKEKEKAWGTKGTRAYMEDEE